MDQFGVLITYSLSDKDVTLQARSSFPPLKSLRLDAKIPDDVTPEIQNRATSMDFFVSAVESQMFLERGKILQ